MWLRKPLEDFLEMPKGLHQIGHEKHQAATERRKLSVSAYALAIVASGGFLLTYLHPFLHPIS
jgi:hypothetical protein